MVEISGPGVGVEGGVVGIKFYTDDAGGLAVVGTGASDAGGAGHALSKAPATVPVAVCGPQDLLVEDLVLEPEVLLNVVLDAGEPGGAVGEKGVGRGLLVEEDRGQLDVLLLAENVRLLPLVEGNEEAVHVGEVSAGGISERHLDVEVVLRDGVCFPGARLEGAVLDCLDEAGRREGSDGGRDLVDGRAYSKQLEEGKGGGRRGGDGRERDGDRGVVVVDVDGVGEGGAARVQEVRGSLGAGGVQNVHDLVRVVVGDREELGVNDGGLMRTKQ